MEVNFIEVSKVVVNNKVYRVLTNGDEIKIFNGYNDITHSLVDDVVILGREDLENALKKLGTNNVKDNAEKIYAEINRLAMSETIDRAMDIVSGLYEYSGYLLDKNLVLELFGMLECEIKWGEIETDGFSQKVYISLHGNEYTLEYWHLVKNVGVLSFNLKDALYDKYIDHNQNVDELLFTVEEFETNDVKNNGGCFINDEGMERFIEDLIAH